MNKDTEADNRLRAALREWKVDAALPPRFQEQVWQRITQEAAKTQAGLWTLFTGWVETAFSRPALAFSYVAVLLAIGLTTGFIKAQGKAASAQARWRTAYVQSIDPYQIPRGK